MNRKHKNKVNLLNFNTVEIVVKNKTNLRYKNKKYNQVYG